MGSSMGGLMSLYAAWERPDVFGAAACLSTHWPGSLRSNDPDFTEAFISYLKARQPAAAPRLYFDYGTEALDARYELHQLRIDAALDSLGIARQTRRFDGASHNEASWRARLAAPLGFLLGKEAL
jgi:enterochelin esterase-like enzyme